MIRLFLLLCLACSLSAAAPALAAHGQVSAAPGKPGILLVAFGTSVPEAAADLDAVAAAAQARFPEVPVRVAWSSEQVRRKIARTRDLHVPSPAAALARMMDEGFTHVAVQSLHVVAGREYHDLEATVRAFAALPGAMRLELGEPLLSRPASLAPAAAALLENLPAKRTPDEAVILFGHGTDHPGGLAYPALQQTLSTCAHNVFVGTAEGVPGFDHVLAELDANGAITAWLVPLMSVAGDHARDDMAGDDPDSLASRLKSRGITVRPVLRGLAGVPGVADLWLEHLDAAWTRLGMAQQAERPAVGNATGRAIPETTGNATAPAARAAGEAS